LKCRAKKTSEQWTKEFRESRAKKLDKTYYEETINSLNQYFKNVDLLPSRSKDMPLKIDKMAIYQQFKRFSKKFFDGDNHKAYETIINFNHKIVSVEVIHTSEKMDFYDLEVEESKNRNTHNFALAAGVFVHNSAKDGRDPEFQAILPIRGKIINAEKKGLEELLKNKEIQSLIIAIGTGIKEDFDIERLRYNKIIIMADADDDGCHIATLLITFFYRYMRQLVLDGHVYLAQPPLFCIESGKTKSYCWTDKEMQAEVKGLAKSKVVRFKGLGEMDAEQLADTTMDVSNRRLIQLQVNDLPDSERIVSVLMGSNVQLRKDHITNQVNSVIGK
jgi:DNA gyrase subunit B